MICSTIRLSYTIYYNYRFICGRKAGWFGAIIAVVRRLISDPYRNGQPSAGKAFFLSDDVDLKKAEIFMR